MSIAPEQLKSLYPRASAPVLKAFADAAPAVFAKFEMNSHPSRLEYFLAQIGHELGGLTTFEEGLNYSAKRMCQVWPKRFPTLASAQPFANNPRKLASKVYAGRMGNGDETSGDGFAYRGRGFIQITGRDGYRNVGQRTDLDLEKNPDLAGAVENFLLVAAGFWKWKDLHSFCDKGDFTGATRRINGGTVGLEDRKAWLDKARRVLAAPFVPKTQPDADEVRAVQLALRARGDKSIGTADGDLGPKTAASIRTFRRQHGLGEGLIDAALLKALDLD